VSTIEELLEGKCSGSGLEILNLVVSIVVYYFIEINRYMFRSYDHL
jgi:hypothetical protein